MGKVMGDIKFNSPGPGKPSNPLRGPKTSKELRSRHTRHLAKAGLKEPKSPLK